jgi:hypothetical protein
MNELLSILDISSDFDRYRASRDIPDLSPGTCHQRTSCFFVAMIAIARKVIILEAMRFRVNPFRHGFIIIALCRIPFGKKPGRRSQAAMMIISVFLPDHPLHWKYYVSY